jgi:hypothetical protein
MTPWRPPPGTDPHLKARVFAEHPLPWILEDDHIWDADGWAVLSVHGSGVSPEVAELLVSLVNQDAGSALRASQADGQAHAVPLPTDPSDPPDSRALSPAPPLPKGTKIQEQPDSLLHPDHPGFLPHPLMLQVAEIDGTLKPEFQEEYGEMIDLDPGSLDPVWWMWAVDGQPMSARERHGYFNQRLDETSRELKRHEPSAAASPPPPGSDRVSPTPPSSMPQLVLRSLLLLRSEALADI